MKMPTLQNYYLAKGASEGGSELNAFDNALLNAGIGNYNLLKVSSILPPGAQEVIQLDISNGALVPVAYSTYSSKIPGEIISAGIAIGIPTNSPAQNGVIMEYATNSHLGHVESNLDLMIVEGMEKRGIYNYEIIKKCISLKVQNIGAVVAGVLLL